MSQDRPTSITPALIIQPLTQTVAAAAFALAKQWRPNLDEERWSNFLCDWSADQDGRGILAAHNQRGAILGFACWWRQPDLEHGETLWAGPFIVYEMGVRPLVREALHKAVTELATQYGIALRIHEDPASIPNDALAKT